MARYHDSETEFSGMISEDMGAPANLPQSVVHKNYPPCAGGMVENYQDNIKGIDKQEHHDFGIANKNAKTPKSY